MMMNNQCIYVTYRYEGLFVLVFFDRTQMLMDYTGQTEWTDMVASVFLSVMYVW